MAVPKAPVRVLSQRPLAPSVSSVTSVANDKGDNEMILGAVHRSPVRGKPQKTSADRLMKGLCDQSLPHIGSAVTLSWLLLQNKFSNYESPSHNGSTNTNHIIYFTFKKPNLILNSWNCSSWFVLANICAQEIRMGSGEGFTTRNFILCTVHII